MLKPPIKRVYSRKHCDLKFSSPEFESDGVSYGSTGRRETSRSCIGLPMASVIILCVTMILLSIILFFTVKDQRIPYIPQLPWLISLPMIATIINCRIEEFDCCCREQKDPRECCYGWALVCDYCDYNNKNVSTCRVRLIYSLWIGYVWTPFLFWALLIGGVPKLSFDHIFWFLVVGSSILLMSMILYEPVMHCYRSRKNDHMERDAANISGRYDDEKDAASSTRTLL